ncbi:MAG: BMP family ABC transporter substrate-binding protein [Clostridium sp.]
MSVPWIPSNINDFLVGYLEGVKYVDPEIKVVTSYVGSFEDVSKCMEMTTQLYNQGAQVVYALGFPVHPWCGNCSTECR